MRQCRRCAAKSIPSAEEAAAEAQRVRGMRGVRTVPDGEYDRRLKICEACENFEYGSTCMLCGCMMQVRAMLVSGRCPAPGGGKW